MKVMTFISWIKRKMAIDKRAKREGKGEKRVFASFFLSLALPLFHERERERERKEDTISVFFTL